MFLAGRPLTGLTDGSLQAADFPERYLDLGIVQQDLQGAGVGVKFRRDHAGNFNQTVMTLKLNYCTKSTFL